MAAAPYRYADPRCYGRYEARLAAAYERRDVQRKWCSGCRQETNHAHGSRFPYCLVCLRTRED